MKKGTTLLRTLLLVLLGTMLGKMSVSAQEAYAVYTSNNTTLTFYYDSDRNTHTLSTETVYNLPTGNTQPAWYTDGTYANVTKVSFTSSFSSAQPTSTSYWFYHMSNLTSISNLRYLNTSSVTSMNQMFAYCSGLTSLDLSNFDTGKVTTMQSMFWECTGLTSINMNNFNTENVTTMYGMFKGCSALTTLDIRYFKTPVLANIQEMFFGCSNLTTIYAGHGWTYSGTDNQVFNNSPKLVGGEGTKYNPSYLGATYARVDGGTSSPGYFTRVPYVVWDSSAKSLTFYDDGKGSEKTGVIYNLNGPNTRPGWDTNDDVTNRSVTAVVFDPSFANARPNSTNLWFAGMEKLTSITGIKYLNTSQVTNMSYMFSGCKLLTFIDVRHFDTSKATNMYRMFYSCIGLTRLDLTSFYTHNVTNMGGMFEQCNNLKTIYVGENWSTAAVSTSSDMFKGCTSLVGQKGTSCNGTNNITYTYARVDDPDNGNPGYLTKVPMPYAVYANGTLTFYCDGKRNEKAGTTYNLNLGNEETEWYSNRTNVTKVVFDPSFAVARPYTTHGWFKYHAHITSFTGMEYLNTSEVTDMGSMFVNCVEMETFDLSNFDTRNVTDMQNMFQGCTGLTTLDLSTFDTESLVDMDYMFYDCTNLTTIIVDNKWNAETVGSGNVMFYNCSKLTGGAGTTYNASHNDKTYARIDKGPSSTVPGYLTAATKPYAVYNSSTATLTFYCDGSWYTRIGGTGYSLNVFRYDPGWSAIASQVNKVVFDASFADARPTTIFKWFDNMSNLTEITDMKYLNTSEVTDMDFLFSGCQKLASVDLSRFDTRKVTTMAMIFDKCWELKTLDVSSFNTENVKDFSWMFNDCNQLKVIDISGFDTRSGTCTNGMFSQCSSLTTIYVGDAWKMDNIHDSSQMFQGCSSRLMGGYGTIWSESHIDGEYARIDGGPSSSTPGYFTSDPGYAVYDAESKKMTFYCDGRKAEKTGMKFSLNTPGTQPMWLQNGICDEVTKVVFDGSFGRAYPKTTAHWFRSMDQLSSIEGLQILNTRLVTSMDHMFAYCEKLTSIDVSHFDTRNVTSMASTFEDCRRVKSLDLSNFDTSNVNTMYCMFRLCYWLDDVNLSSFNSENVTNMTNMFYACGKLTTLNLASFNTSNVTYSQSMFEDCTELTTIYVSRLWDMSKCYGPYMFLKCPKLKGGAGTVWASTNSNDNTYAHVDGGTSNPGYLTQAPAEAYAIYTESDHTLTFYYDRSRYVRTGKSFTLNTDTSVPGWLSIGLSGNATRVVFDPSFANVRPTTTNDWFVTMYNLVSIEGIEYLNTSEVTNMTSMFSLCESLESVDVSGFDTRKVTTMNSMFNGCRALKTLDLTSFDVSQVTDMQNMFSNCTSLTTIYAESNWNEGFSGSSSFMFTNCPKLVGGAGTEWDASFSNNIDLAHIDGGEGNPGYFSHKPYAVYNPADNTLAFYSDGSKASHTEGTVYGLNTGDESPGWVVDGSRSQVKTVVFDPSFAHARPTSTYMWFGGMYYLTSINDLEYLNTSEVSNMSFMFENCTSLTTLDLSSWNTNKVEYMQGLFHNCSSLTTLDLTGWETGKVLNMVQMFAECDALTTIYIGDNWDLSALINGGLMFSECYSLVGGAGTPFDSNHVNETYAHIDGGTSNPGYFTQGPASSSMLGDVNGDNKVNVADVTALVNMLKSGNVVYNEVADVDGDGSITNIDVKALVYNILGSYALMYVEDVFTITGRGTVATGQILKGMFRTGQTAVLRSISDAIADVEFTISGIEMTHQTVDVAVAGDNVGILVPVDKANVQRGDVLTIKNNPELRHSKTMKGTLYVLTKEEGGRHTPFSTGYRPQMYVAGADFTVKCTDLGKVNGLKPEVIMPGDTSVNIVFEVVQDGKTPYVYPGQVVLLREGGRTVGRLTITE